MQSKITNNSLKEKGLRGVENTSLLAKAIENPEVPKVLKMKYHLFCNPDTCIHSHYLSCISQQRIQIHFDNFRGYLNQRRELH